MFLYVSQSRKLREKEETVIWYVMQCPKGQEETTARTWNEEIRTKENAPQMQAFVMTYEKMKRYEGSWHLLCEPLFPGYVFLADEEAKTRTCKGNTARLGEQEKSFLEEIGGEHHHIPMSKGYIKDGIPFVTEGPLCGKEQTIRKIDRHKRLACLESPFDEWKKNGFWAGLEIVSKS